MDKKLLIGFSEKSITPDRPILLAGQFHIRIAQYIETPCMVTAMAVETEEDVMILCSCDLVWTSAGLVESVRKKVSQKNSEIPTEKIILSAIHTHTGPAYDVGSDRPDTKNEDAINALMPEGKRFVPNVEVGEEVLRGVEAREYIAENISDAVCEAWENRQHSFCGAGFGRAVVGHCRRVVYQQGVPTLSESSKRGENPILKIAGGSETGIEMLFICDNTEKPVGVVVNVACPSHVVEYQDFVSSDYWGKVKVFLREYFGDDFYVVGLCSAAGDQAPRESMRHEKALEPQMDSVEGTIELGKRIANVVIEAYDKAKYNLSDKLELTHKIEVLEFPVRNITEKDYLEAKEKLHAYVQEHDKAEFDYVDKIAVHSNVGAILFYEWQKGHKSIPAEIHVVKFGNVVFATNPFELFLDYGTRIKFRSPVDQTFLIQLACDTIGYLPTADAEQEGDYSTNFASCPCSCEAGDMLVERTLEIINSIVNG